MPVPMIEVLPKTPFKEILVLVFIDLVLVYSISVHIRNIVFIAGIVVIFISTSLTKKNSLKLRMLESLIVLIGIVCAFLCYLVFPHLFYGLFFSPDGITDSTANASIQVIKTPIRETLTGILYVFAGNVYQSIIQTYGIVLFSYYYVVKITKKYMKISMHNAMATSYEMSIDILFMFSSVLYLVGLLGLAISQHGNNRASGYWRYYGTYSGLMLLLTLYYLSKETACTKISKFICMMVTLFLFKYLITISDWITSDYDYLTFWFVFPYKANLGHNELITTLLIVILGITILLFSHNKIRNYTFYLLIFYVALYLGNGGLLAFTSSNHCDASYELIEYLDNNKIINVKTDIFFDGTDQGFLYLQWMLQGNALHRTEATADSVIFSDIGKDLSMTNENVWMRYQIDDNEYVYVQNVILSNAIEGYLKLK